MRNSGNDQNQNRTDISLDETSNLFGLGKSAAEKDAAAKEVESKALLNAALAKRLGNAPARSTGGAMQKVAIAVVLLTGIIITVMLVKAKR